MKSKVMVRGTLDVVLLGVVTLGLVALAGCGSTPAAGGHGEPAQPTGKLATGGASNLYAVETGGDVSNESVPEFVLAGSGSVSPVGTLLPPASLVVGAVATDSTGQIYVGGNLNPGYEILVYAAGASGAATPLRTITLDALGEFYPISMTVDASGKLYVASGAFDETNGEIAVFAAAADGAATPVQLITITGLVDPLSMAVDTTGKIYLSGLAESAQQVVTGEIVVFAAGATGNATPLQTITAAQSTETTEIFFWGLAVDGSGDVYTVQDTENGTNGEVSSVSAEIVEFAAGATGMATPVKTISGSATGLSFGGGMRIDSVGNLYLANETLSGDTSSYNLLAFGPFASGNVAPGLELSSSALTTPAPEIAVF